MPALIIKLCCFLAVMTVLPNAPHRLSTYTASMDALKNGETVKVVIHYAKCRLIVEGKETLASDAMGGMEFRTWEQFAKGVVRNERAYVTASETVLISHPRYGYVLNYVKLRIAEDNTVEIIARYLKPGTYEVVMDETFRGALSDGKTEKGVACFVK